MVKCDFMVRKKAEEITNATEMAEEEIRSETKKRCFDVSFGQLFLITLVRSVM